MRDIDVIAGCNPDNLDIVNEIFEKFDKAKEQEAELPEKLDIVCYICRGRVGFIIPVETDVPLRGSMIHRHPGCEHWEMPLDSNGPIDFICPHAAGGDNHLFIPINENDPENSNRLAVAVGPLFDEVLIEQSTGECPCGCGGRVKGKNKYADNLKCYRRHLAALKAETDDGAR